MQEVSGSIPLSSTTLRPYGLRLGKPADEGCHAEVAKQRKRTFSYLTVVSLPKACPLSVIGCCFHEFLSIYHNATLAVIAFRMEIRSCRRHFLGDATFLDVPVWRILIHHTHWLLLSLEWDSLKIQRFAYIYEAALGSLTSMASRLRSRPASTFFQDLV